MRIIFLSISFLFFVSSGCGICSESDFAEKRMTGTELELQRNGFKTLEEFKQSTQKKISEKSRSVSVQNEQVPA